MMAKRWRNRIVACGFAVAVVAGLFLFARNGESTAAQDKEKDKKIPTFYGVSTCKDCHAVPGNFPTDFVLMTEYTTWQTQDKHALAYAVLEGPRGQQMAKLLELDVTKDPKCLNCHATTSRPDRQGKDFLHSDGVSCDGCHGPAENWILPHAFKRETWRSMSPQEKEDLGMFDVRNPIKRTQMCMSCHVGNTSEGKVVTHAMYAAGHPPLPSFETASFSKNLPQHWRDIKDVPYFQKADAKVRNQNYGEDAQFQGTKLVLATCSQSLRSMMDLLVNRATFDGKPQTKPVAWPPSWLRPYAKNEPHDRWPELPKKVKDPGTEELQGLWPEIAMAQSDCFACHHDLKSDGWRQRRGYVGRPGRPQIQPWVFSLVPLGLASANEEMAWTKKIKNLTAAMDGQPFGNPKEVAAAALDLEHFSAKMLQPTAIVTRDTAQKLLQKLLTRGAADYVDYDSARQIAWATRIVFTDWNLNHPKEKVITDIFTKLDNELNLTLESSARKKPIAERYDLTKNLAQKDSKFAEVLADKEKKFAKNLQEINNKELTAALIVISDYNPAHFKSNMETLAALINGKK